MKEIKHIVIAGAGTMGSFMAQNKIAERDEKFPRLYHALYK